MRVKFQGAKIQQKRTYFKRDCKLCPQDLTKWYSGLKSILHLISSSENLKEIAPFDFQKYWLEYRPVWGVTLLINKNCP